jgi:hypothetical protein
MAQQLNITGSTGNIQLTIDQAAQGPEKIQEPLVFKDYQGFQVLMVTVQHIMVK